jgi:hypothetical protein
MSRVALAAFCLAGCSYTFGGAGEEVRLIGEPPHLASDQPRARQLASQARHLMFSGGKPWVILRDKDLAGVTDVQQVQLVPPLDVQSQAGTFLAFGKNAFYALDERDQTDSRLIQFSPGSSSLTSSNQLTPGPGLIEISDEEKAFVWLPNKAGTDIVIGQFGGPKHSRPRDEYWSQAPGPLFDSKGDYLLFYRTDGEIVGRRTTADTTLMLGAWRATPNEPFAVRNATGAIVVCSPSGIEVRPVGSGSVRSLTREPCRPEAPFATDKSFAYYVSATRVRSISLDGFAAPRDLGPFVEGRVFLSVGSGNAATAEQTGGAGAAWIGERRIMERGRMLTFSTDGKRVRFLEHAATLDGVGELYSWQLEAGEPELIGHNCRRYAELPDGRVLAAVNQAFVGAQNRVVVIDEVARTAHYVAAAAKDFEVFPDGTQALVGLSPPLAGNATDWVVLPIPTRTQP